MKLSQSNKVFIIVTVGAVFLAVLLNESIKNWQKPDIRFEEGPYYNTTSNSITVLKLKNYGSLDAEEIIVNAIFNNLIKDIYHKLL